MASNNQYEIDDFMVMAKAIAESQQNQESEQGLMEVNETIDNPISSKEQTNNIEVKEFKEVELTPKQKDFLTDLDEALQNIANLSDKEVKAIFNDLKTKFYAEDKEHRKQFKSFKKVIKKTIKSDKKRTWMRHLKKGKWISVLSFIYGGILARQYDTITFPRIHADESSLDYAMRWVDGNLYDFMHLVPSPQAEAVVGAFALGIVMYAGGKGLVKYDDIKTMRRMMIQAVGENMTMSELQAVKRAVKDGGSVKDAMVTYPLRDYGKSPETLAQERLERERIAREKAEAEKKAEEERSAKQKAKEDDGMEM